MFFDIKNNLELEYKKAIKYFPLDYINSLWSKESIVSRFIISKKIEKIFNINNYLLKFDENWIPLFDNGIFWSISHKDNLVFVWVHNELIWIDLEIYKERDLSVLDQFEIEEYNILWWKNWDNFYILWTAKESVIKFNLLNLNDLSKIKLIQEKNIQKNISNLEFSKKLLLSYNSWINQVYFWRKDEIFYSVCINCVIE